MKVLITGGAGFLGSHITRLVAARGDEVLVPRSINVDLRDLSVTRAYLAKNKPDLIIHLAARVGGIGANQKLPGTFFYDNMAMGLSVLEAARQVGTPKVVVTGTVCAYPKFTPVPFKEDDLWDGYPEETNAPYGIAKKSLLVMAQAYRQEFGSNFVFVIPVNLYGPCFSPDTDVLTPDGIRNVSEIAVGDAVYSLNPNNKEVEVATVVSLTRTTTREWFHFKSSAVDFKVTPDHSMFYRTSTRFVRRPAEWFRGRAGKMNGQMVFAHHKPIEDISEDMFSLEPYKDANHVPIVAGVRDFTHSHSKKTPFEFRLLDFAEFVGWYVTEGCTRIRTTRSGSITYEIAIAQQNMQHRCRIQALLQRMGFVFSSNELEFHFSSRLIANYVHSEIGIGAGEKHLPGKCFGWGLDARLRLLNAMMAGDGNANGRRYTSKSLQLAEDFCHLAFTCGWKARINQFDGCYRVSIRKTRTSPCVKYKDIHIQETAPETALCFTLDRNHIVYAGRNRCLNWVGQCDNFDPQSSHVIPAMIRKFLEARDSGSPTVSLWGDGSASREFLYVEDAARGILAAADNYDGPLPINLGTGDEITMKDLALEIAKQTGFQGELHWDTSKPNGQPRRQLDVTRAKDLLGWESQVPFSEGLQETISWYEENRKTPKTQTQCFKKALITGVTGQDGSYLSEFLLAKGYQVHGIIRRSSSFNTERVDHLMSHPNFKLHYGDLTDSSSLQRVLTLVRPDEVYHLGAQSHVQVSFEVPDYTCEATGVGTLRLLEAIRSLGLPCRVYQAATSELFGKGTPPYNESAPFYPRSPYGAAKALSYHITRTYREAYGMFALSGILFNHECLSSRTPLIVRQQGTVNVVTPNELVPLCRKGPSIQQFELDGVEVWDGTQFVGLSVVTATKRRNKDPDHALLSLEARAGVVEITAHHGCLDADNHRKRADSFHSGDRVLLAGGFPTTPSWTVLAPEFAELLGYLAADGYVPESPGTIQFTNNDKHRRDRVAELWSRVFLGGTLTWFSTSGFAPYRPVGQINLNGAGSLCTWIRKQLYTPQGLKRVPPLVLNADLATQKRFLDAYYEGDGLKAGNGESAKTNSPLLAQGLCWMYHLQSRQISVYVEHRGETAYFQLNLSGTEAPDKGQHLRKDPSEVRRVEVAPVSEWVFDIETGSGVLMAGVGRVVVHNSERRGETFVTRKITRAVGRIKHGLQKELVLGNLQARRDWGYAPDYVEAMWLMLQQDTPEDFVIGTGEAHSVQDFVEKAFSHAGLDWKQYVQEDARYLRPAEVDVLIADPTKAKTKLGWQPKVSFDELVTRMVDHDMELAAKEAAQSNT